MTEQPKKNEGHLAKCHKCGATLIALDDGQPYWCTHCSWEEDHK